MCLAMLGFFVVVSAVAWYLQIPSLSGELCPSTVFWVLTVLWFVVMSAVMTLIDKPHLAASKETIEWLFMFSAFLGIPVAVPLFSGAIWALAHDLGDMAMEAGSLALVMLGSFGMGCAVSNMHDLLWCGIITNGYSQHYKAGYDLDVFVAFGQHFGLERDFLADYTTLGPCALALIVGELLVAGVCYARLKTPR